MSINDDLQMTQENREKINKKVLLDGLHTYTERLEEAYSESERILISFELKGYVEQSIKEMRENRNW